jgi:hypothetical protein
VGDFADDCNCADEGCEDCEADMFLGGLGMSSRPSDSLPSPSSCAIFDLDLGTFPPRLARRLCMDAPILGMVGAASVGRARALRVRRPPEDAAALGQRTRRPEKQRTDRNGAAGLRRVFETGHAPRFASQQYWQMIGRARRGRIRPAGHTCLLVQPVSLACKSSPVAICFRNA